MKSLSRSFAALLPILALIFSIGLLMGTTAAYFYTLKHAAHGSDSVSFGTTPYRFVIRSDSFFRFAFMSAAMWAIKPITILNAPAHFVDLLISYAVSRKPFWSPNFFGMAAWQCLTYPFFAIPAWSYVGLGLDAFFDRRRIGKKSMVLSLLLSVIFGTIAVGLRFGLTPEERRQQDLLPSYIAGLSLWGLLFLFPFIAWLREKITRKSDPCAGTNTAVA
jgi:hypothetical protein